MAKKKPVKTTKSNAAETLETKLQKIADHTRRVGRKIQNGLFLYGRQGTSKTYTITETLRQMNIQMSYNNGHVNPEPLFDMFCGNPGGVIVLDDVSHILGNPKILDILLAALGTQGETGRRKITYKSSHRKKRGDPEEVDFTGGVILISNIAIGSHKLHQPLLSRLFPREHDLTDGEMEVLFCVIAQNGYKLGNANLKLSPKECREAADFVLQKCKELDLRPNVRHLVELAYKCRLDKDSTFHWQTHVEDGLREAKKLESAIKSEVLEGRPELVELINIIRDSDTKGQVLDRWMAATGNSRPTFFRKLTQLPASVKSLYDALGTPKAIEIKKQVTELQYLLEDWQEEFIDRGKFIQTWIDSSLGTKEDFYDSLEMLPELKVWFEGLER